jgi:hypothetical protein
MLRFIPLFLIIVALIVATGMAFMPRHVLNYIKSSRAWTWYLRTMFNIAPESLERPVVIRIVRIQGGIGLIAALIAMYAWFSGPAI